MTRAVRLLCVVLLVAGSIMHCGSGSGGGGGSDAASLPVDATAEATADAALLSDSGGDSAIEMEAAASDGSDAPAPSDAPTSQDASDAGRDQRGCPADAGSACFTVYAHTSTDLYYLDLVSASLVAIGPFAAQLPDGGQDILTDLAVGPDDTVWVVSHTALYRADPSTGQAHLVGPIAACGSGNVALTADTAGALYLGDTGGTICKLDPTTTTPTVTPIGKMSGTYALAGDLVVAGTTAYASVVTIGSPATLGNNSLATVDLTTLQTTAAASPTGFPKLYGLAYGMHRAIAFAADGSGTVVTLDPASGAGTRYTTFIGDAGRGVTFAGAGVNPRVAP